MAVDSRKPDWWGKFQVLTDRPSRRARLCLRITACPMNAIVDQAVLACKFFVFGQFVC